MKPEPTTEQDALCIIALGLFAGFGLIACLYILVQVATAVYG